MFIIDVNNLLNENQRQLANKILLKNNKNLMLFANVKYMSTLPSGASKYSASMGVLYNDSDRIPCLMVKPAILYVKDDYAFAVAGHNKYLKTVIVHKFQKPFKLSFDQIADVGKTEQCLYNTYDNTLKMTGGVLHYDKNGKIYCEKEIRLKEITVFDSNGKPEKQVICDDIKDLYREQEK